MFRLLPAFTLFFFACATTTEPDFVFAAQAIPPHADQVHCDGASSFADVVARHHITQEETLGIADDRSKATDLMSRHPGLLADILSVSRCDTTTPTLAFLALERVRLAYAAALDASAAPTVDAGRSLWRLGEQLRAGSLFHLAAGATFQEEAMRSVLGPALDALPAEARAAAIADLRTPPSLAASAENERALLTQLPLPLPGSRRVMADTWLGELRCRLALPQLLTDIGALDALPPAERPEAWAAQHEDHEVCADFDGFIAEALERDVTLIRALEGA